MVLMHDANKELWRQFKLVYPQKFDSATVLEVGSLDVNGSIREFFRDCDYTGVDWREGNCVDVVCLAHEMDFKRQFDVVASASMLEHDPYWKDSLNVMQKHMNPDGILLLSWGAAENAEHCVDTAPDNQFHALPAYLVVNHLNDIGMYIEKFIYERQIMKTGNMQEQGWGCVGLVAFNNWRHGLGVPLLSHYRVGDDEPNAIPDTII
jgi:SAM-dependent methyltransferase